MHADGPRHRRGLFRVRRRAPDCAHAADRAGRAARGAARRAHPRPRRRARARRAGDRQDQPRRRARPRGRRTGAHRAGGPHRPRRRRSPALAVAAGAVRQARTRPARGARRAAAHDGRPRRGRPGAAAPRGCWRSRRCSTGCPTAPTVVVLEDLHWADEPSLVLLGLAADRAGVLVVATYRDTEAGPALRTAVADLRRRSSTEVITLRPWDDADVAALLPAAVHPSWAPVLRRTAAGLPLLVTALLEDLLDTDRAARVAPADGAWPLDAPERLVDLTAERLGPAGSGRAAGRRDRGRRGRGLLPRAPRPARRAGRLGGGRGVGGGRRGRAAGAVPVRRARLRLPPRPAARLRVRPGPARSAGSRGTRRSPTRSRRASCPANR